MEEGMSNLVILIIKFYQFFISPILGNNCRFIPTCSEYAVQSIKQNGLIKSIPSILKRIISCNPLGGSGYNPVNKKKNEKKS